MTHNISWLSMDYEDIISSFPPMNKIGVDITEENVKEITTFISSLEEKIEQLKTLKKKLGGYKKEAELQLKNQLNEELLPCPMCQKPATCLDVSFSGMIRVGCSDEKCYCSATHSVPFTNKHLAISLWNNRQKDEK